MQDNTDAFQNGASQVPNQSGVNIEGPGAVSEPTAAADIPTNGTTGIPAENKGFNGADDSNPPLLGVPATYPNSAASSGGAFTINSSETAVTEVFPSPAAIPSTSNPAVSNPVASSPVAQTPNWLPPGNPSASPLGNNTPPADNAQYFPGPPVFPSQIPVVEKPRRRGPGWFGCILIALLCAALVSFASGLTWPLTNYIGSGASLATQAPVKQAEPDKTNWETVTAAVEKSVVSIQVVNQQTGKGDTGSGVIIDTAGHVVTNYHVVADVVKGANVMIQLFNNKLYDAKLLGADPSTDLAVLAFKQKPKEKITMAHLGDSLKLRVAQPVAAIGAPLGLTDTVTTGIISSLNRPVVVAGAPTKTQDANPVLTNAIQVDAAINPGNSGGPLFDAQGSVIGINSSIASLKNDPLNQSTSGSIGIGFAIPVNLVKTVADQIIRTGKVVHAMLGVQINDGLAKLKDGDGYQSGAMIKSVVPGSGADEAGLKPNQLITAIDEHPVENGIALTGFIRWYLPGEKVTLTVLTPQGEQKVKVVLKQANQ